MKHFELLTLLAACALGACSETYVEGTIKTTAATSITDKSAVCGGTLSFSFKGSGVSDLVIQETGIAWALSEEQLLADSEDGVTYMPAPNGSKEGSFACLLENLATNTTYYFWAYAYLINGDEKYILSGEISKFTTLPPSEILISTVDATGVTKTTAVVGGNIRAEGRPPYVERGVCYSTASAPTVDNLRVPAPGSGTGEYRVTLTGLTEGALYYARAYAINANGATYGEPVTFRTQGAVLGNGAATVDLSSYLAICNGIYYYFSPSSNAKSFYWDLYADNDLPGSDEAIVQELLASGMEYTSDDDNEGYTYNLSASTPYTLCMIAFDNQDRRSAVVKKRLTTKSSSTSSQPIAAIRISNINTSTGEITYSFTKNSYCASYVDNGWNNLTAELLEKPDIFWAEMCYQDYLKKENVNTNNHNNYTWSNWPLNSTCSIVTLGFSSNGANSGVISLQLFSTATGQLITRPKTHNALMKGRKEELGIKNCRVGAGFARPTRRGGVCPPN